jgi:8-amino-3,8-dideoxy-alpha-D-manno-octulosonate transaminase
MSRLRLLGERAFYTLVPLSLRGNIVHHARRTFTGIERHMLYRGRDLPIAVNIETNTRCTRSCHYCSRPTGKNIILDTDIVFSVIDQLKEWGFKGRVSPHSYNEPLTDARIFDFLKYSRKQLPLSEIVFYTNGDLLNESTTERLMESGVNELKVSLHQPTSEELEARSIALRQRYPFITVIDRRDGKRSDPLFNRGGSVDLKSAKKFKRCYYIDVLVIRANGDVVLCCQDAKGEYVFGNVKERSIEGIWDNSRFAKLRQNIRKGKYALPICKRCSYE